MPTTVNVVLATYNGERYLDALLESLARQTCRPDRLIVRDDGSSDRSVAIVRDWSLRSGIAVQPLAGPRLGPARAFLEALRQSPPADVHLLADQDDVWVRTKVARAVAWLREAGADRPVLYASRLQVVDAGLRRLYPSPRPRCLSFASAACESLLTGCTMALNEPLRRLAVRGDPRELAMHDWWLYLLATASGRVLFDPARTVLYRQHGSNVLGAETTGAAHWLLRLRRFASGAPNVRGRQLREFVALYRDVMSPASRALADELLAAAQTGRWSRLRVALTAPILRQKWHDNLTTRVAILANRF